MQSLKVKTTAMKRIRCANGIHPWTGPAARRDTRVIYKETFEQRCYEKHGVGVADGDIVFDVGSHVGLFALSLMERFRNLRLYCFEPVPHTHACLERNLAESLHRRKHKITVLNVAVGANEGEAK